MKRLITSMALALASLAAFAAPVTGTVTLTGFDYGTKAPSAILRDGNTFTATGIGAMTSTFDDGGSFEPDSFLMYCIELTAPTRNWGVGETYVKNITSSSQILGGQQTARRIESLFFKQFEKNKNNANTNATESAAMQLAIWEILYEDNAGPLNLGTGDFKFFSGQDLSNRAVKAFDAANVLLAGIDTFKPSNTGLTLNLDTFTNGAQQDRGFQDFISVSISAGPLGNGCDVIGDNVCGDVPEPTSLALAALGLFAAASIRRKTKQA